MTNKWNDKSWQKDFLNMKSHSPADAKLLMGGVKGLKDAWRLGVLHVEYEKKRRYKINSNNKLYKKKKRIYFYKKFHSNLIRTFHLKLITKPH